MNILFITRAYSEHAGGMERLSFELIQSVSKLPDVTTTVIAHKGKRVTSPLFNFTAAPKALSLAQKADVIHLGDPMLSFLGWLLKLLTKKPIAVTVHGLDITYPNFLYQLYLKFFFCNFDAYFPISRHVSNLLSSFHIPHSKFHIQVPGLTDRFFDPTITRDQLAQLLKHDIRSKHILFTSGRLIKRKGHAWFIENVLPKLPDNVIYVIAGEGPEKDSIEKISERSRPNSRLIFPGRVTDEQLKILYNTVDAFIMPNIPVEDDVEGFGLVLLEAALCQRPVFAANLEGIPDAIHDGRNGTLLPPQNPSAWISALQNFLSNPQPNPAARDYTLKQFSWSNLINHYAVNIKNLL